MNASTIPFLSTVVLLLTFFHSPPYPWPVRLTVVCFLLFFNPIEAYHWVFP